MIVVGILGVILVGLAIRQFRDTPGAPSSAGAVEIVEAVVNPSAAARESIDGIADLAAADDWRIPSVDSLRARLSGDRARPSNNPFVLSKTLRAVVDGVRKPEPGEPSVDFELAMEQWVPEFQIRSAYEILGQWFVEINGQVHSVGDVVEGSRILAISSRSVRLSRVIVEDGEAPVVDPRPTSVVLTCGQSSGLVGERWVRSGDRADGSRVVRVGVDGVVVERIDGDDDGDGQSDRGVEVRVEND